MSVIVSSGTVSISSGVTSTGLEVIQTGKLRILNSGWALETVLADGGEAIVSGGGILYTCMVSDGGTVTVLNNGYTKSVTVDKGGLYLISSGGNAYASLIQSGGTQIVYADALAANANVSADGELHVNSFGLARAPVVSQGGRLYLWSRGESDRAQIYGTAEVNAFGVASRTTVLDCGKLILMSKGSANETVIESGGRAEVSSGGIAKSATVNTGGTMTVLSGGTATGTKEAGGWVEYGDAASVSFASNTFSALILGNASATVHSGTTAVDVKVGHGGLLTVFNGGSATGITENGGWVEVADGATVTFVPNTVSNLALSDASATVHSGTVIDGATVNAGGRLEVFSGGTMTGQLTFADGAVVSASTDAVLDFDLSQIAPDAGARVNDLSLIQGTPVYTLTVSGTQETGSYQLAGGAADFNGTITVRNMLGELSGTLTVGGQLVTAETVYALTKAAESETDPADIILTLSIAANAPPTVSNVRADITEPTNKDVVVRADFEDDYETPIAWYRIGQTGIWTEYQDGVTVTQNEVVYFKAVDSFGTESETVSFEVNNIDKTPPVVSLVGDNVTPLYSSTITASTEPGLDIFYSTDDKTWTKYEAPLDVTANATYYFKATDAAGNTGAAQMTFDNILPVPIPENLVGTKDRVSWDAADDSCYLVEFSTDGFAHGIRAAASANAVDMQDLPEGTWQWRVRSGENDQWVDGSEIISDHTPDAAKVVQSNADGCGDLFFASVVGTWGGEGFGCLAQHVGSVNDWNGTNELVFIDGKGRIQNLFIGSDDPNILCLTDGGNGEVLFLDDVFTELPEDIAEHQARIANIREIRAGAGADVIDLTSQRFEYTGDGMTVRGGDGGDVIWANQGSNFLFGDAGNDIIAGASGNDVIAGGIGNDRLHGGGGNDVFIFCENWGEDAVQQVGAGSVTLWFVSGSEANWNDETLTYTDGDNSVTVSGAGKITLKFGDDGSEQFGLLTGMGAFADFSSQRVFEESGQGILASL